MSAGEPATNGSGLRLLPKTFSPSINEVIIGRGRKVVNHCGNLRFQDLIQSHLQEYSKSKSKTTKSAIIMRVLATVKEGSPADVGGFVKQDSKSKRWYALEDASARISTAQAFRDALSGSYRSSKQYKQQRRWNRRVPIDSSPSIESTVAVAVTKPSNALPVSETVKSFSNQHMNENQLKIETAASAPLYIPTQTVPKSSLEGLRGIIDNALKGLLMDDDMFQSDLNMTPDCAWSSEAQELKLHRVDHLDALLDRIETQVEVTENPFEPTPLVSQIQEGEHEDHLKPSAPYSNEAAMSLRNALTYSVPI